MKREIRDAIRAIEAARKDLRRWYTTEGVANILPSHQRHEIERVEVTLTRLLDEDGMLIHCLKILESIPQVRD